MKLGTICVLAMLCALGACSDTINGKSIAEPEVAKFHEQLKAHQFEAIYDSASPEFKAAVSKSTALALFSAIDRKLGALQETKQVGWNVSTRNLTTTVVLSYQSKFQDGSATETFTYHVDHDKAEFVGYNISSLDMLIK